MREIPCVIILFADFDPPMNPPLYMNFFERAINFYNELYDWGILEEKTAQLFRPIIQSAFGPDFPPLEQHLRNTSLLFVNSNPFLEFPRPLSNKVVYIGGLVDQKTRKLDEACSWQIIAFNSYRIPIKENQKHFGRFQRCRTRLVWFNSRHQENECSNASCLGQRFCGFPRI